MGYLQPDSVTLNDTKGRYSCGSTGVKYTVKGTTKYYVYARDPSTYKWWKKGQITSSSGLAIYLGANNTSTSEVRIGIILSDTDYGSSSITVGDEYASDISYVTVPLYVARIYSASSSYSTYDSSTHNLWTYISKSGYSLEGYATSSSTTVTTYDATTFDSTGWVKGMDGQILYAVFKKSGSSFTGYYYRGSSAKKSVSVTTGATYVYGKNSTYVEDTTLGSMTTTCLSNSSYSLQGWAISSSSRVVKYTDAADAYAAGNTTIYGVYYKAASTSNNTVHYYRGSSAQQSVAETATTSDGYYYGTGTKYGGITSYSYGTITTSCLSDSNYSLVGWTSDSNSTTVEYTDAETAFNSYNTIYGIYKKAGSTSSSTCYYYRGDSTKNSVAKSTTTADAYYYGTGSHTGGTSSTSYGTITTDCAVSGWTFLGFSSSSSTQSSTSSATSLFNAGNTTIYGTYSKTDTMTYYPENGDSTGTTSVTNYRYGTGSVTDNSPTEPTLTYDGYTFLGWASTADGTADTWDNQYDSGTYTVYAIWEKDGNVYLGVNGEWILLETYYGVNGKWVPMRMKVGANNAWKE